MKTKILNYILVSYSQAVTKLLVMPSDDPFPRSVPSV